MAATNAIAAQLSMTSIDFGVSVARSTIELRQENVKNAVATLGPNAAGTHYAYLSLAMANAGLTTVDFLGDYPQLQALELRNNQIKDLAPLGGLADLVRVDASQNRLTNCLDFVGPTNIVEADLSRNEIADIGDISAHASLERLTLHNNRLTGITGLGLCTRLTVLDLSENSIVSTRGLEGLVALRTLRLSNNSIAELTNLDSLKALIRLDLDGNLLTSLAGLEQLEQLHQLDVKMNEIAELEHIKHLLKLPSLVGLDFSGNPLQLIPDYRLATVFRMQQLVTLDLEHVTPEEKVAAVDLFDPPPQVLAAVDHAMHLAAQAHDDVAIFASTPASEDRPYPVVVLSGPAREGKRLVQQMMTRGTGSHQARFAACRSHTTRPAVEGERDAGKYCHVTTDEFKDMVVSGLFFQTCRVSGHMYGVTTAEFERIATAKKIPVLATEIEAVFVLRKMALKPVYVYVRPEAVQSDDFLLGEYAGLTSASRLQRYESLARRDGMFGHTVSIVDGAPVDGEVASVRDRAIALFHKCWDTTQKAYI